MLDASLRRIFLGLGLLTLVVVLAVAALEHAPGYMDADYYLAGGERLAQGYGFSEQILWNYLDDPAGLPHASHAYWMPLASIVAALGMRLLGQNFDAGRLGFILIALGVPLVTSLLAYRLGQDTTESPLEQRARQRRAWIAGLLAILPAFYLPYLPTADTFGIYMLGGSVFLLLAGWLSQSPQLKPAGWLVLGMVSAGMHLTRADGLLWLGLAAGLALVESYRRRKQARWVWMAAPALLGVAVGYLLVFGPWLWRNQAAFGSLLSPGGSRALWLSAYDELFSYPASILTTQRWLESGWPAILQARLWALGQNLQTALAVQGEIFLAPLVLAGAWRLRGDRRLQVGALAWLLTLLAMTVVFPFAGARGGFFHSGAAVQPLFWAVSPYGLEGIILWIGRRRGWNLRQANTVFQAGVVLFALGLSLFVVKNRVLGPDPAQRLWNADTARYLQLEQALAGWNLAPQVIAMVNNPPGLYLAAGRPAVVIPYGDLSAVLAAARRYHAGLLLLEIDQVRNDSDLFNQPADRPGLHYLGAAAGVRVYRIEP